MEKVQAQLERLPDIRFGKHSNNRKRPRDPEDLNWTKKSIFYELPYFKKLKLRHNIDVMHVEKNICESHLCTMVGLDKKSKDTECNAPKSGRLDGVLRESTYKMRKIQ